MDVFFDKEKLCSLMNDFNILTNIRIVIYDVNFNEIASVPDNECRLCCAIRQNPNAKELCDLCTQREGINCSFSDKVNIYRCHLGLIEAIAPLKIDGIIVGYIMLGQIIDEEEKNKLKPEIINYASMYCDDDIESFFYSLTSKNTKQIQAAATLMESCTSYILMNKLCRGDNTSLPFRIKEYIYENIESDLSVECLCEKFEISRNMLYKLSKTFYGIPIADYIRKRRIEIAKMLLKKGIPVTEVSSQVGFSDYSYFSKVFKRETGVLPSKLNNK